MTLSNVQRDTAAGEFEPISNGVTVDDLRARLQAHYPFLQPRSLREIAIVGAASEGQRLLRLCNTHAIKIALIADEHPAKIGTQLGTRTIAPVADLASLDRETPVVIASHRVLGAVERIRALGFRTVMPFAALQLMAPDLFPPHMFYNGLLDDMVVNRPHYFRLREQLADGRSRAVFDAVLAFRQTMDPTFLKSVLDADDLYAPKGIFSFSDDETYVEGGSYDGDTIRLFIRRVSGRFRHVYAFEPDPKTFATLQANFSEEPRVEPIHAGLHRHKGVLRFRNDASRGAVFAEDGDVQMPVTTIDDVIGTERVTYIKMNIEGAEIDALYGGQTVIKRDKPKLALSVYHRPSDLWRIPEVVRKFDSRYQLYMRQHDGGIIETVLYAVRN